MRPLNPSGSPVNIANGAECVIPKSIGFQYSFVYQVATYQVAEINGSQWQDQKGFPYAQSLFYREFTGANWEIRSLITNWSWIIDTDGANKPSGFIPFETPGGQINFTIGLFFGGVFVPVPGNTYTIDLRLYTSAISPIVP